MRPTLPVACCDALLAAEPALDAAELAELVTLVRPSDAFDCALDAVSFTALVASAVVEALRMPARRTANVDCRNTARDVARDILMLIEGGEMGGRRSSARVVEWSSGSEVTIFPTGPCALVGWLRRASRQHQHQKTTLDEFFGHGRRKRPEIPEPQNNATRVSIFAYIKLQCCIVEILQSCQHWLTTLRTETGT